MKPELDIDPPTATTTTATPTIEGDRKASPVGQDLDRGRGKLVILLVLLVACGLLIVLAQTSRGSPKTRSDQPAAQIVLYEPGRKHEPPQPADANLAKVEAGPGEALDEMESARLASGDAPTPTHAPSQPSAPLLVYAQAVRPSGSNVSFAPSLAQTGAPAAREPTELEALSQETDLRRLQASRLGDRNFLILAGAALPCVLQTALASSTPGYVTCILSNDVMSDTGGLVLLEKGSRVLGEYRSAMRRGQSRIFVLWTRIVSPGGVVIPLASPATDSLGRAGFDGSLDTHFWERFGGALVLSVVEGLGGAFEEDRALIARPSEAATAALSGVNTVSPALRKDPGAEVMILVAHDLDFSGVYRLEAQP